MFRQQDAERKAPGEARGTISETPQLERFQVDLQESLAFRLLGASLAAPNKYVCRRMLMLGRRTGRELVASPPLKPLRHDSVCRRRRMVSCKRLPNLGSRNEEMCYLLARQKTRDGKLGSLALKAFFVLKLRGSCRFFESWTLD